MGIYLGGREITRTKVASAIQPIVKHVSPVFQHAHGEQLDSLRKDLKGDSDYACALPRVRRPISCPPLPDRAAFLAGSHSIHECRRPGTP